MLKPILASLLALTAGAVQAAPITPARSSVQFVYTQMNVSVAGQFKKFSGDVVFDPAKPAADKVNIVVELAGVDASSSDADETLQTAEWFDVAHFPKATFSSTQFKSLGGNRFEASGQFSLKGHTASLVIPFTVRADAGGQWLEGSFPLSRLAWKVGTGEWADVGTVADAVQVKFKLYVPK